MPNVFEVASFIVSAITLIIVILQIPKSNKLQFESTFFNMLSLHNDIISKLPSGRSYFEGAVKGLEYLDTIIVDPGTFDDAYGYHIGRVSKPVLTLEDAETSFKQTYDLYYRPLEPYLSHYFRNLYYIMKFVDQSALVNDTEKKFYAGLVRAQLSQNELHVLVFNSMSERHGYPKAIAIFDKYKIWKNMNSANINPGFLELHAKFREMSRQ